MTIFQKYSDHGYGSQIHGQKPRTKIPGRCYDPDPFNPSPHDIEWSNVIKWPDLCLDPSDYDFYQKHGSGVCLITTYFPFIDIDLEDESLVHSVATLVFSRLGPSMVRTRGGSNRVGIVYKCTEKITAIKPVVFQKRYGQDSLEVNEMVEFLTSRRQFVAEGIHPSGHRYKIENFMPAVQLPTVGLDQLSSLRDEIASLVPSDAVIEKHPKAGVTFTGDTDNDKVDLYQDHEITLSDRTTTTVGDILRAPAFYHGKHCYEPLLPNDKKYHEKIGIIYSDQRNPAIFSLAHSGTTYFLHDSSIADKLIENMSIKSKT